MNSPLKNQGRKNTPRTFWGKVDVREPNECWPWMLSCSKNGYGWHSVDGKTIHAHRYAYYITRGVESSWITPVMHTCNNKRCCNPSHLVLGTASKNVSDAYRDGLARAGERHYNAKVSSEIVSKIRADPRPASELSPILGISRGYISRVRSGQTRKHDQNG